MGFDSVCIWRYLVVVVLCVRLLLLPPHTLLISLHAGAALLWLLLLPPSFVVLVASFVFTPVDGRSLVASALVAWGASRTRCFRPAG